MSIFRNQPSLLMGFREGQRAALEQVYRAYVRTIDGYLRSLARSNGCPDLAQPSVIADFLQDIFIRAFSPSARISYDGLRDYGPYLATIARNYFIDVLRTRKREILQTPEQMVLHSDESLGLDESDRDPRVGAVVVAYLGDLSAPLKAIYDQRFVAGLSQDEVSARLGISRRKVRTAESRLRTGLRRALAKAGISLADLRYVANPGGRDFPTKIEASAVPMTRQR